MARGDREEIQATLKRLQGRFAEDSGVDLKIEKGSDGVASLRVYRKIGDEEKLLGYLPQVYSKYLVPAISDEKNKYEVFIERITKGFMTKP